jgi:hypothetical protein
MITTEKKSNKIQHELKFIKYSREEIFSSNHNVFVTFIWNYIIKSWSCCKVAKYILKVYMENLKV